MKSLIVFALAAVLLNSVMCDYDDDDSYCRSDIDCDHDECCVQSYFPGRNSKVCRDRGDDIGERCGGLYECSTCDKGLVCLKDSRGGSTCQRSTRPYNRY